MHEAEQSGDIAFKGFDVALAGGGIAVQTAQDAHGGLLIDGAHITLNVGREANSLHVFSVALVVPNVVDGEATLGQHLLDRNPVIPSGCFWNHSREAATAQRSSSVSGSSSKHNLDDLHDGGELSRIELVEQLMRVLLIDVHGILQRPSCASRPAAINELISRMTAHNA